MLTAVFYWLVNMSIAATLAGLLILLLRTIRPLPRRFIYPLWAVVLLRLWFPFGIASRFSILQLLPHRSVHLYSGQFNITGMNCVQAADSYFPLTIPNPMVTRIFHVASMIWLVATLTLLIIVAASYVAAMKESRCAIHLQDNIYLSDRVSGPVVYGIFRPRILLPNNFENQDSALILNHERIHIRRLDNLWRLLALATACIHWFNPLIWLFLRCFLTDLERSCDETVLCRLPAERHTDYAHALLDTAAQRSALNSPFGHCTAARIRGILSYRRLSAAAAIFLALCTVCIAAVLLTNAQ